MIKDWNMIKKNRLCEEGHNVDLPRFPDKKPEIKIEVSLKISNWSPQLAKWFLNKTESERELIVFEAYRVEKLKEVGCTNKEINEEKA